MRFFNVFFWAAVLELLCRYRLFAAVGKTRRAAFLCRSFFRRHFWPVASLPLPSSNVSASLRLSSGPLSFAGGFSPLPFPGFLGCRFFAGAPSSLGHRLFRRTGSFTGAAAFFAASLPESALPGSGRLYRSCALPSSGLTSPADGIDPCRS